MLFKEDWVLVGFITFVQVITVETALLRTVPARRTTMVPEVTVELVTLTDVP